LQYSVRRTVFDLICSANKPVSGDKEFALLRRAIRIVLNPSENEVLPASNYAIYSACHTVVSVVKKGEGLFNALRVELEKCVGLLVRSCVESEKEKIPWLGFFVTTCKWFETRIVSVFVHRSLTIFNLPY
jgi:cullin-4